MDAEIDAAETIKSIPSSDVSDQIGRFVTPRRTPVYPATKNPRQPPTIAMTAPSGAGGRHSLTRGQSMRPSSDSALKNPMSENRPKSVSPHEPIDIGDHDLNM